MAGDRTAFGQLVARHQPMVYRLCRRHLPEEAEDLAQETFVRAFVQHERYDPALPLGPWLATIARRLCLDRLRRRKPEPGSHERAVAALGRDLGAERHASSRQELVLVQHALNALPEGPREAVWLYHWEGLAYAEIAAILHVPIGTIMTWLHRARLRLATAVAAPARTAGTGTRRSS